MTTTILVAESLVLVLLAVLVAGLLRSHAEILRRLHALSAGLESDRSVAAAPPLPIDRRAGDATFAAAADILGSGLRDDAVHIAITGSRHHTMLAFLSSGCLTCHEFWSAFADAARLDLPDDMRLVIVTKDGADESISTLRRLAPRGVPVVLSSAAWADYNVPGSPYFVLVDGQQGRVRGEGTGSTWEQVQNLFRQAADDADDASREARIDRELRAHGIEPGDPSLYRTAEQIARSSRA